MCHVGAHIPHHTCIQYTRQAEDVVHRWDLSYHVWRTVLYHLGTVAQWMGIARIFRIYPVGTLCRRRICALYGDTIYPELYRKMRADHV